MASREQSHLLDGALDFLVLKVLESEEMHSFGISARIEQITKGSFHVKLPNLMAALHRMEANGWLNSGWAERGGRRHAKYYWLTGDGRRQLAAENGRMARVPLGDVIETVVSRAGLEKDNSRLASSLAQEAAERERMQREMELVRQVQQTLLPHAAPNVPGVECVGLCRPAFAVGGDCYDFLSLPNGRFAFAIGDVSGKGLPAALLMASVQAFLRAATFEGCDDLAWLMRRLNKLLLSSTAADGYATLFYAQYDPVSRELSWVNAGHNPPLLLHEGEFRALDQGGPVIGLLADPQYEQGSARLAEGDLVLAYTDGITEAANAGNEEWGESRLRAAVGEVCADGNAESAEALLRRVLGCADRHAAGTAQRDDMTLVALRPARVAKEAQLLKDFPAEDSHESLASAV